MSMPPMVAMFQVKRLKALSRRRRWISDACIRTDMALLLRMALWLEGQFRRKPLRDRLYIA